MLDKSKAFVMANKGWVIGVVAVLVLLIWVV